MVTATGVEGNRCRVGKIQRRNRLIAETDDLDHGFENLGFGFFRISIFALDASGSRYGEQ